MTDAFVTAIKILASLSALYMCLSPSTAIYRIHVQRSTGQTSIVPLVALWGCNHMWLLYGYVTGDIFPLMVTYIVGVVTSVAFIAVYYRYTTAKPRARKLSGITLILNTVVTLYAVLGKTGVTKQPEHDVELIVGIVAIASSILLYASPLATISLVVKTRSSESIPFAMVMIGLVNNALWIVYGVLVEDALLVIPCVVSVVFGVIQVVLYFWFHPKRLKLGGPTVGSVEVVTHRVPHAHALAAVVAPQQSDQRHLTSSALSASAAEEITLSSIHVDNASHYIELQSPSSSPTVASSSTIGSE